MNKSFVKKNVKKEMTNLIDYNSEVFTDSHALEPKCKNIRVSSGFTLGVVDVQMLILGPAESRP
jgi:hypothetical protein